MAVKKITKRERFEEMVALFEEMGKSDLVEFCNHEIALLDKKNASKSARQTEEDEKRVAIGEAVIGVLVNADSGMTCTEICKAMPTEFGGISTQKMTPILTKLVTDGELTKAVKGGKSIYSLA